MSSDKTLLRSLFEAHGQQVYRRALRLTGRPADAEEAMQEVFIRAMQHIDELRGGHAIRWLYRVTTNYCLNRMRDSKRRRQLLDERGAGPTSTEDSHETLMTLRRLLALADEREATAVTYVYVDQLSQREAADLMGVSLRTLAYLLASFRTWAAEQMGGR